MDFRSDNVAGAAPEIFAALQAANAGNVASYGADDISRDLEARFAALFEIECRVFPVATGTAANALALAALCPAHGAVYCHQESHIQVDECDAPEAFTGGAKLVPLGGAAGKIDPAALARALGMGWSKSQHHPQPSALSLTQATEAGTVYSPAELAVLTELARGQGLHVHMDGARFANAIVSLNASAADLTWRAGVDVLSFGATKNGALAAEAVVFFKPALDKGLADNFLFRRKRAGHLFSKMRFLSAQLVAMLEDDLWLRLARNANARARQLADGLGALPGVEIAYPVQANEVFITLPAAMRQAFQGAGILFHPWSDDGALCRFVCAFDKTEAEVARLLEIAAASV